MATLLPSWVQHRSLITSLDLTGLVFLADIDVIARRTAYTGGAWLGDVLVLCPGLHKQQDAPSLSGGEYPACAAMTTGYVFRVENEATALFLQRVSKTGHLTTLSVSHQRSTPWSTSRTLLSVAYLATAGLTTTVLVCLYSLQDYEGITVAGLLIFVRLINMVVLRRRTSGRWHGQSEPGVQGDLLILLSQDRWVRMQGAVDDLKAITSGQWLRDPTAFAISLTSLSTILVYLTPLLLINASQQGKMLLLLLMLVTAATVMITNAMTNDLRMNGRLLRAVGSPKPYARRLDLAQEMIQEHGRRDWALRMGMVQPEKGEEGPVTM